MSFLDIGMFIQTFMLAAKDLGLDTCAPGAWNMFWTVTRHVLDIGEEEHVVAGMSLGYTDLEHPVNGVAATREPVDQFVTFHGFASSDPAT